MKFEKDKEDRRVSRTMTFVDRYGTELKNFTSYDTDTGIAVVFEPDAGPNGHGNLIKREKFHPQGFVIMDDLAKPNEEDVRRIREKYTGRKDR